MHLKTFTLTLLLLAPLALSSASADAGSVAVAMDADTYSVASTLTGAAPLATVSVLDGEGAGVAGATVRVVFLRQLPGVGYVANETVLAQTGEDGIVTVAAPQLSGLPGSYTVIAFQGATAGSDRYSVGA
ncbi:MAG TPA: hypothetical protein VM370_12065 [Candidatus Thermoplasmatota archaeon]|nr:hypothetical protein [Candidatus Thermoplasmatota archaeon]